MLSSEVAAVAASSSIFGWTKVPDTLNVRRLLALRLGLELGFSGKVVEGAPFHALGEGELAVINRRSGTAEFIDGDFWPAHNVTDRCEPRAAFDARSDWRTLTIFHIVQGAETFVGSNCHDSTN